MTVATKTTVELLHVQPETSRAQQALRALHHAAGSAGIELTPRESYTGDADWLLLWGPGAPARADLMRQHIAAGGHAIALDLAYWHRDLKVRVSIDAAHPQRWVMRRDWPRTRLAADRPVIRDAWKADGAVLIAGIGQKATAQYGADLVAGWEAAMRAECQARWPGRLIIDRPKPIGLLPNVEAVLQGVGLVITWHSNIAVDAIRLGIPVVCRDGAAAAVCPSDVPVDPQPLPADLRDRFLANLAWFQWAPNEATQTWRFLQELIG